MPPLFTPNPQSWQINGLVQWFAGADPSISPTLYDSSPSAANSAASAGDGSIQFQATGIGPEQVVRCTATGWVQLYTLCPRPPFTVTMLVNLWVARGGGYIHIPWSTQWAPGWNIVYAQGSDSAGVNLAHSTNASIWTGTGSGQASGFNVWFHIACVLVTTNLRKFYFNGVHCPPDDTQDQPNDFTNTHFGTGYQMAPHNLDGWFDDVRFYNRVLTDQEISELAHPQRRRELYVYPAPPFTPLKTGFFMN